MSASRNLAWSPGAAGPLASPGDVPAPWMEDALCAEVGGDYWHPEKGGSTRQAKMICRRCPVTAECLDYAFAIGDLFGIYGGLSAGERKEMRRQRQQAAAA
jgi:WhiB family transcriptional regulator, redox-sensing transcriptional regulator